MNTAKQELREQLHSLIPQLSEDQLVDLFEDNMTFDGYLSNSRRPDDGLWENARDWLKDYIERPEFSEDRLEDIVSDIQCKIDYPDS